ncbi:MAG: NAD-dependent epimerase/dehydratase family protein [Chloroflexi bacterium]|nr:MAG: NAD-dependent epimerase/dehydratase family protein [Chloroflexota bacterium]
MKQQTILVTGGAGFVGSVCVELLVAQGYSVIVLDNLQTGNRRAVHPKARLVRGSIGNARLLQRIGQNTGTRHHLNYRCKSVIA